MAGIGSSPQPTAHSLPRPASYLLLTKALQPPASGAASENKKHQHQQAAEACGLLLFGLGYPAMGWPEWLAEESQSLVRAAPRKLSESAPCFDLPSRSGVLFSFLRADPPPAPSTWLSPSLSGPRRCTQRKPRQRRRLLPTAGGTDGYYLNLGLKSSSGAVAFQFQSASERCREHNVLANSSEFQSQ